MAVVEDDGSGFDPGDGRARTRSASSGCANAFRSPAGGSRSSRRPARGTTAGRRGAFMRDHSRAHRRRPCGRPRRAFGACSTPRTTSRRSARPATPSGRSSRRSRTSPMSCCMDVMMPGKTRHRGHAGAAAGTSRREGARPLDAGRPALRARGIRGRRERLRAEGGRGHRGRRRDQSRRRQASVTCTQPRCEALRRGGRGAPAGEQDPLSDREREVLRLLALGHTNQEIAKMLFISVRTAETHRAHIMQKLGL